MSWKMFFSASYDRLWIPSAGKSYGAKVAVPLAPRSFRLRLVK